MRMSGLQGEQHQDGEEETDNGQGECCIRRRLAAVLVASLVAGLALATPASVVRAVSPNNPPGSNWQTAYGGHYPLGGTPSAAETLLAHKAGAGGGGPPNLPSSLDWSNYMPPVGDQGTQGSCTAWAVGYALKTFQEFRERGWTHTPDHEFSPSYIYNQLCDGVDQGIRPADALDLLVAQGCDTIDSFYYDPLDWVTQPNEAHRERAAYFKARDWATVDTIYDGDGTMDPFKVVVALQSGPVVAAAFVWWEAGWDEGSFTSPGRTEGLINYAWIDAPTSSGDGTHAICIVGYNSNKSMVDGPGAFKFINSWGTGWATQGYGWMSYSYFTECAFEAEQMGDLTGAVAVLRGDGAGGFELPTYYGVELLPRSIAVADFNGDGHPDLAVVNSESDTYSIPTGNGDCTFRPAISYPAEDQPTVDLAIAHNTSATLSIYHGNGDGTFQVPVDYPVSAPRAVTAGDFNADGRTDVVVVSGQGVYVFLGSFSGAFRPPTYYSVGGYVVLSGATVGDLDGNGRQDLVVWSEGYARVSVLLGQGNGLFNPAVSRTWEGPYPSDYVLVGDFTAVGLSDLAVASNSSRVIPRLTMSQ